MSPSAPRTVTRDRVRVDAGRLWGGGVATMLVAAGVAVVGVLAARALFSVPMLERWGGSVFVVDPTSLAVTSAVAALLATGLLHVLAVSTPRAYQFFAWISSLVIAAVILRVFLSGSGVLGKLFTAALYLIIGAAITSLLHGVGRAAVRYERVTSYDPEPVRGYGRDYADDSRGYDPDYGWGPDYADGRYRQPQDPYNGPTRPYRSY
ncbi:MAG TPA: DUF6069 family protein [Streptosporangiaceae bacterium]|nr:DUF6069 family protein [Streptosporangiaceae bacterium]